MRRNLPRIADALRAAADICIAQPNEFGHAVSDAADAFEINVVDLWTVIDKVIAYPRLADLHDSPKLKASACLEVAAWIDDGCPDGGRIR